MFALHVVALLLVCASGQTVQQVAGQSCATSVVAGTLEKRRGAFLSHS